MMWSFYCGLEGVYKSQNSILSDVLYLFKMPYKIPFAFYFKSLGIFRPRDIFLF